MRKPKQVLVFLYRMNDFNEYEYCIFNRKDMNIWQAISGGVESDETLIDTVKREVKEETGINVSKVYELSSISSIPVINITGKYSWGKDVFVVTEYSFGVPIDSNNIKISDEHIRYEWLTYEKALEKLEFDSNKTALWELNERLLNNNFGEYVDLYNENKEKTGETLFREKGSKLIVPERKYRIVVLAFIENSKGEFLFQMTSKRKNCVWATTGGHVKSGQTSTEAILEEIKEELGLTISENEIEYFKTYKYESAFKDVFYIKKDINTDELVYEKDEVEYVKFLTKEEILNLINNEGNIRKTNIDAFLDIISSHK